MSIILGQDGTGFGSPTTGADLSASGGAMCLLAGYTAIYSGTGTTAYLYCGSGSTAAAFKICVYQGAGVAAGGANFIASSNVGTVGSNALVGTPITAPLVAGTVYTLLVTVASGFLNTQFNTGSSAFADSQFNSATFNYTSPPSVLPSRTSGTGHEFTLWLDGIISSTTGPLPKNYYVLP